LSAALVTTHYENYSCPLLSTLLQIRVIIMSVYLIRKCQYVHPLDLKNGHEQA